MDEHNGRFRRGIELALRGQPASDTHSFLINQGRAFVGSHRVEDVDNEQSIYTFIENPSDSGFDYDIVLLPRSTGLADIDISFGAAEGDAGDTAIMNNLKSSSPRTFSGHTRLATSGDSGTLPSHGTTFVEDFVPGSGHGASIAAEVIDAIAFTVDEGSNKLLEITNVAGGGVDRMALNMVVFEVDGTYKETEKL